MSSRPAGGWHLADADLDAYVSGALADPALWSTEAHLGACAPCRERLTAAAGPRLTDPGWQRLDATLDAPNPGLMERLLVALGVPEHTGRLLAATPALRGSWLTAVAVTLTLMALLAQVTDPTVFLAVAPLLPLAGVAASYGPGIDPTYEITLVAPIHVFRLLLLRTVSVLAVNTVLAAAASLTVAGYGGVVVGWFVPSLALTVAALLCTPRLGPVVASAAVGLGWVVLVGVTGGLASTGDVDVDVTHAVVFTRSGQGVIAALASVAAVALWRRASAFETTRSFSPLPFRRPR